MSSPLLPAPAASLPPDITRADFFAGRYCFAAHAVTGDQRLIEILRDVTRQYIVLRHVQVIALDGADPIAEYHDALLKKADVDWVAVRDEPPRASARLYGFVRKTSVRVALVMPTCRIEGKVHIDQRATDPTTFFLRGLEQSKERYLPVTDATIIPAPAGADTFRVAIVNRDSVRLYSALTP